MNISQAKKYFLLLKVEIYKKHTYSPLGKSLEKQTKTIQDQVEKQIMAIKDNKKQQVNTVAYHQKDKLLL